MRPDIHATPKLVEGVRLNEKTQQPRMLLLPNSAMRVSGPSLEIVQLCDGKHTVQQMVEKLQEIYAKAEPDRVAEDVLSYLKLLREQGAVSF